MTLRKRTHPADGGGIHIRQYHFPHPVNYALPYHFIGVGVESLVVKMRMRIGKVRHIRLF